MRLEARFSIAPFAAGFPKNNTCKYNVVAKPASLHDNLPSRHRAMNAFCNRFGFLFAAGLGLGLGFTALTYA
jgi:hypothetical protein